MTRDMGPRSRCMNDDAPPPQPFQYPLPPPPQDEALPNFKLIRSSIESLISHTSSSTSPLPDWRADGSPSYAAQLIHLAWQCASTFRATDYLGGCNGARIRLSPESDWPENKAADDILTVLGDIKSSHPSISWSDLIVLAGTVALEQAAGRTAAPIGGLEFCGGRTDATDHGSPSFLSQRIISDPILAVNDDALVKGLSLREYVALQGLPRSRRVMKKLGYSGTWSHPSELIVSSLDLSNEYFIRLVSQEWTASINDKGVKEYVAVVPGDKAQAMTTVEGAQATVEGDRHIFMTEKDLAIKSDPVLHAIALEYASDKELFLSTLASTWSSFMLADRFEAPRKRACEWH